MTSAIAAPAPGKNISKPGLVSSHALSIARTERRTNNVEGFGIAGCGYARQTSQFVRFDLLAFESLIVWGCAGPDRSAKS